MRSLLVLLAASATGCATLATSPAWTGGGLAETAPARQEAEDRAIEKQQKEVSTQPAEIGAKHILVMHSASQRKPPNVTRTRDEARKRAEECLIKLRGGGDFDALVKEYSDEPGAAERNGDLGVFERTQMVPAFGDAAFALKIGEVSEVVETPFGFHVIQRTE